MNEDFYLSQVADVLGRKASVQYITTPKTGYIVEYFNFNTPPPPIGDTVKEACILFIEWFKSHIKENPDAVNTRATGESRSEDEGSSGPQGE